MANHKSAEKRARQNLKKRDQNKSYLSQVRTVVKSFKAALSEMREGKVETAQVQTLLQKAQSALHKAAAKGILHSNNASRRVSRLSQQLRAAQK